MAMAWGASWQCLVVLSVLSVCACEEKENVFPVGVADVVVVVLSQANSYHAQRARLFAKHLKAQVSSEDELSINLLHERWPQTGAWTVLPTLPSLQDATHSWVFFCEEETRVNLKNLLQVASKYDSNQEQFIGHALHDREPTIIHHFAFIKNVTSFHYPDFAAGFLLSMPLVTRLSLNIDKVDFSIDAKHELAMKIWNKGDGVTLTDDPQLCTVSGKHTCATTYPMKFPECGAPIAKDDLFVAVKTCKKFHDDRVPVVLQTWASDAKRITFYSDEEDSKIPTTSLGIANTEKGHCAKTLAILQEAMEFSETHNMPWVLVTDDDTLISVRRLRRLLACYDANEAIVLGERYSYGAGSGFGYDYITGGGGMVFSQTALQQLLGSGRCHCGKPDSPDDMILGMCFRQLAIPLTHSPLFHQARPDDYSEGYLERQIPVSFHKHWNVDPYLVYDNYLQEGSSHDEL